MTSDDDFVGASLWRPDGDGVRSGDCGFLLCGELLWGVDLAELENFIRVVKLYRGLRLHDLIGADWDISIVMLGKCCFWSIYSNLAVRFHDIGRKIERKGIITLFRLERDLVALRALGK